MTDWPPPIPGSLADERRHDADDHGRRVALAHIAQARALLAGRHVDADPAAVDLAAYNNPPAL